MSFFLHGLTGSVMANSKRKCRWCKTYGSPEDGKIINGVFYCSLDHAIAYGRAKAPQALQKAHRAEKAAYRAETKAMRSERNQSDHKWQTKETQRAHNAFIRALDADQPCIVHGMHLCGHESAWNAGHYLTVASQPALRFDPRNCFKQCASSNKGDARFPANNASIRERFELGITTMHSPELLQWLKGPHPTAKHSCEQLAVMRAEFKAETKRLESGLPQSRDWRSLK